MRPITLSLIMGSYFYVAFCFANLILTTLSTTNHMGLLDFGLRFIRTLFGAFSTHLGLLFVPQSRALLREIRIGPRSKLKIFFLIVVPLYGAVQFVNLIQVLMNDSASVAYGEDFLLGLKDSGGSLRPAVFVHWVLFIALSVVPGYLISGYVELCTNLRRRIRAVASEIKDVVASKRAHKGELKELQLQIFACWEQLKAIDKLYSTAAFAWFIDMIITVVLSIRSVMRGSHSIYSALDAIYYLFLFFVLALNASDVDCESKCLQEEVHNLRRVVAKGSVELGGRVMLMENGLKNSRIVLNSGHFCSIDRPFIVAVLGAMATYTILLVQLAPDDGAHPDQLHSAAGAMSSNLTNLSELMTTSTSSN